MQPDARTGWKTYITSDLVDATAAKISEAGGSVLAEPFDVLDAGRVAFAGDPTGGVFGVWQAGAHKGAQLVNEPGTWNWSELAYARRRDGARLLLGGLRLGGRGAVRCPVGRQAWLLDPLGKPFQVINLAVVGA